MAQQEFDENLEECGLEELYQGVQQLPQTEHLYVEKVRKVKDRLEELHRINLDEFYHRKKIIEQAIREREKGDQRTMPVFTLEELKSILIFTERLYGP